AWITTFLLILAPTRELLYPTGARVYIDHWMLGYLYIVSAMLFFLATTTVRIFRSQQPVVRQQSRVIIFGSVVAFTPMMVFYLLPTVIGQTQEFRASIYFPLLIILPLSVTYAILRYRLLDVDRLFSKALTYTLTTVVALGVFYGLVTGLSFVVSSQVQADNPIVIAAYLLLLVLGLLPLRDLVKRAIDRLFYRAPADYRRALSALSTSLVVTPNLERTLQTLEEQVQAALSAERFIIYLYDDDQAVYLPHSLQAGSRPSLQANDPIVRLLEGEQAATWLAPNRDLPPLLEANPRSYERLGCVTFVPLRYEGRLIGFLALGAKRSGDPFTSEDLDFLTTVAGQSTLALENARLFTNLRRTLDQTLEMKNLMDDIFASIATGVITTDLERKVTLFNQAAENILGIPVASVIGRRLPEALPDLCPGIDLAASNALEHGALTLGADITPHMPERGDLYLRLSCAPLRDAYLGTRGATIVIEDLTERHKLQFEQERIRQTFGRVVAPRVRDRLLSDPTSLVLDGTRQKATILFADLSGFTSFSEVTRPELLFQILNGYLSEAAQAILDQEGTLDKFMGDAVLALWNAPDPQADHALRAVRAALDILARARQAHRRMKAPEHRLLFRIGVSTGDVMVGNVGTSELFNYTAVGDTVNLAQRLEVTAQPGQILIDQNTYEIVARQVVAEALEPLQVKGKSQPVKTFDLKGLK
ncbi:MAG: GAF domain-containing protein, partial [Chloroflexi bacterium]|nr:GAF domain-containing protein [Chloroflexota bacterium]